MNELIQSVQVRNTTSDYVNSSGRWTAVLIVSVITVVSLIDRNVMSIMIPEIRAEFHLSDFEVSLIQGLSFALFYGLGGVLIGALVDVGSKRLIMFGGMTVWSFALVWSGLAGTYKELFASRMVLGAGEGTVSPCATTTISSLYPPSSMALPMSVMTSAGILGLGLSFAVGGWLLETFTNYPLGGILGGLSPWRQVFIVLGIPGVAVALLVFLMREPPRAIGSNDRERSSWAACCRHLFSHKRAVGGVMLSYGMVVLIGQGAFAWAPTYARRILRISAGDIGQTMLLLVGVGGVIGMLGMGFLVDRLSSRNIRDASLRCLFFSLLAGIPIGAVGFLANSEMLLYIGILAIQLMIFSSTGTLYAALHTVTPANIRGRMTSVCAFVINIAGYAIGPMTVGLFTDFVYRDEGQIGVSIATLIVLFGLGLLVLLWYVMPRYGQLWQEMALSNSK